MGQAPVSVRFNAACISMSIKRTEVSKPDAVDAAVCNDYSSTWRVPLNNVVATKRVNNPMACFLTLCLMPTLLTGERLPQEAWAALRQQAKTLHILETSPFLWAWLYIHLFAGAEKLQGTHQQFSTLPVLPHKSVLIDHRFRSYLLVLPHALDHAVPLPKPVLSDTPPHRLPCTPCSGYILPCALRRLPPSCFPTCLPMPAIWSVMPWIYAQRLPKTHTPSSFAASGRNCCGNRNSQTRKNLHPSGRS